MKTSHRRIEIVLFILLGFCASSVSGQQPPPNPISLHPDNSRYFQFRGEPTVLVTSGEHYGVVLNTAFDYEVYFDELAAHGLNHSRVFQGSYREAASSFGITQNPLAPTDEAFSSPWARTDKTHRDGSPIFDLSKWNEAYFERLRNVVADAASHGIVLEMTLFSPMYQPEIWDINPMNVRNNINKIGDCGSQEVFTTLRPDLLETQSAFAQKMVRELYPFDNVYFEVCNEPYFGGVTELWQRAIIDAIVQTQKGLGCRKLISVNVANKSKRVVDPHPAVSLFNFHYCHPPIAVQENAALRKPIGENETGFRGSLDFLYRTEGWDFLVAGGALFNNLDYSFSAEHPAGTLTGYRSPGGGSRDFRAQLGILKKTFDLLPLVEVAPQSASFVRATHDLAVSAIGQPGSVYLVYAHVVLPSRVKDDEANAFTQPVENVELTLQLPRGAYQARQIDTVSGETRDLPAILTRQDAPVRVILQGFRTDTAVLITKAGE